MNYTPTDDAWTAQRIEEKRDRLRRLNAEQLEKEIEACAFMCSPQSRWGGEPRQAFTIQRRLAMEEKARRLTSF